MTTYEEEINALAKQYKQSHSEYNEISRREYACFELMGLDSPLGFMPKLYSRQFHRRALELQEVHGIASASGLEELKELRITADYDEELYTLAEWLKQRVLEFLEIVEKDVAKSGVKINDLPLRAIPSQDYDEFERRRCELEEKYKDNLMAKAAMQRGKKS